MPRFITIPVLFGFFLLLGSYVIDDYGVGWDTEAQRTTGNVAYEYVFNDNDRYLNYYDRSYGVILELPLLLIEKTFGLEGRSVYLMRNAVCHLLFLIAACFCFLTIDLIYKNQILASIGFLFAVSSPRIYVHSFINPKDVPFYSVFLIAFYFCARALKSKSLTNSIFLGSIVAFLVNLRTVGIILLFSVLAFQSLLILNNILSKRNIKKEFSFAVGFLVSFSVMFYAITPILWNDTIANLVYLFQEGSANDRFDTHVLFMGKLMLASDVHWYYPVVYFFGANPILYLVLGLIGLILILVKTFSVPNSIFNDVKIQSNILFLICFAAPFLAVVIFKPNLSDGWRQLFFLYAPFILLSIYAIDCFSKTKAKNYVYGIVLMGLFLNASFMIKNHPFQFGYFNEFISKEKEHIRKSYEFDYYSLSYRKVIEYILDVDESPHIPLYVVGRGPKSNGYILPDAYRKRIEFVSDPVYAKYYIGNFRWNHIGYPMYKDKEFLDVKLGNNTIATAFKFYD